MPRVSFTMPFGEDNELYIEADVSPIVPAYTSGLPEDCYPAEGGEVEVNVCDIVWTPKGADKTSHIPFAFGELKDGGEWLEDLITERAIQELEEYDDY